METISVLNAQVDTVAALLNQAANDTVYLRTGLDVDGVLEAYVDSIKTPVRPIRFNTPVMLDYSFQGQRYIAKGTIVETTAPHHAILGISPSDMERLHANYGGKVRELLGDIDNLLEKAG